MPFLEPSVAPLAGRCPEPVPRLSTSHPLSPGCPWADWVSVLWYHAHPTEGSLGSERHRCRGAGGQAGASCVSARREIPSYLPGPWFLHLLSGNYFSTNSRDGREVRKAGGSVRPRERWSSRLALPGSLGLEPLLPWLWGTCSGLVGICCPAPSGPTAHLDWQLSPHI